MDIKPLMQMSREQLNHQAYEDVSDLKRATMPENDIYMECYNFWYNIVGGEKHFDPHYCEADMDTYD